MQFVLSTNAYCPALQSTHSDAALTVLAALPAMHCVQAAMETAAMVADALPAVQLVHVAATAAAHFPASQSLHVALAPLAALPATQLRMTTRIGGEF